MPWRRRWRNARLQYVPALLFIAVVFALAILWKDYAATPTVVGQAESIPANISCYKSGMLAQLSVSRFQMVKVGDALGQVLVTDPKILAASLAVIQAEIALLRADMAPVAAQQRLSMEYSELRLHWMQERAQLAMARVNLQLAEVDLRRTGDLFKDKIVSERAFDTAKATEGRLRQEVDQLVPLVEEGGHTFDQLQLTNAASINKVTDEPLRAAIAAQEAKLQLTEAELSPVTLRASVAGMIDVISHRPGEAVTVGETIVSIAPLSPARIIGYLRPPLLEEPKPGTRVEVRTRGPRGQVGVAEVKEVGTQFEPLPPALQIPVKLGSTELGLPLSITVPSGLKIRPGELVDMRIVSKADKTR